MSCDLVVIGSTSRCFPSSASTKELDITETLYIPLATDISLCEPRRVFREARRVPTVGALVRDAIAAGTRTSPARGRKPPSCYPHLSYPYLSLPSSLLFYTLCYLACLTLTLLSRWSLHGTRDMTLEPAFAMTLWPPDERLTARSRHRLLFWSYQHHSLTVRPGVAF